MTIPTTAIGNLLNRAAQAAGKPPARHLDVWKHSAQGLQEQMKNYDPNAPPPPVPAAAGDGNARSPSDLATGMAQQARAIPKQLAQLFHVGDGPKGQGKDGPPHGILQHVGAAFGVLTSIEQLVSMPLGMIPFPALPAVRIGDYDIGLPHAHAHPPNLPPAPPLMLPSTGPVIAIPMLSGATTVLINGRPAARCGDMGLGIWCGGYFPLYEIFLGSSNVWLEGARAARLGVDITKHCIFSSPKPAKPSDPPLGPMFGFTISASGNVLIGGIPMPSLTAKAVGAAFKPLFKGMGKVLRAIRKRLRKIRGPAAPKAPAHTVPLPPPHRLFTPRVTPRVKAWLQDPKLWYGGGRKVIKEIHAGELLALTHATGHEWAVVAQKDGKLVLIHGEVDMVNIKHRDQVLIHTHPEYNYAPGADLAYPSGPDMKNAEWNSDKKFWDHPQAAMDESGAVRYYDKNGVIADPNNAMVPIGENGIIDGVHHMTGGPSNMSALPGSMMRP